MKCPECGFENKSDAKFCVNCGAELEKGVPKREYPIKVKIKTMEEKASRIELFVRIVYGFVLSIIAGIWGFFAEIAAVIQWFYILIMGKRNGSLWGFIAGYMRYYFRLQGYVTLLTDERPPISGEEI